MCIKLFDSIERSNIDPAKYSEPQFQYVNRTNREHFIKVRSTLESWFREYLVHNVESAKDLCKRFRSKDNQHHLAALTELYLHNLLIENGFKPKAHPDLKDVKTKPDFFAFQDEKPQFAVEAVLVFDEKVSARVDKFEANISDAIDAVNSPDFLISFDIDSRDKKTQPKVSRITKFLQEKINGLNYEQVCKNYEETNKFPELCYTQNNWKLLFSFAPVTEEGRIKRDANSRVIGATIHGVSRIELDTAIRDNVRSKSKKYGKFDIPFIIVVNVIRESIYCDEDTIMDAICGQLVTDVTIYNDGSKKMKERRDMNGIWTNPKNGVSNTNVSGLVFLSGLTSGTIFTSKPILWHHPHAIYPFKMDILDIEQRYFERTTGERINYNVKV